MKSLMVKDMLILKGQRKTFLLLIFVCLSLCFINDSSFALGYLGLFAALLSLGTLSYDDYDNGYAFLFTLPVTRKMYIYGKYVFCLIVVAIGTLLGMAFSIVSLETKNTFYLFSDVIIDAIATIIVSMVMVGTMIPFRVKYGNENGRTVSGIVLGFLFASAIILKNMFPKASSWLLEKGLSMSPTVLGVIAMAIGIIVIIITLMISIRIIEKKEY